jgi:nucleotide-binding universal stress UspA family protein
VTAWPESAPRRLLAALDGSATSQLAAEAAVAMAARHGAELVLVHVLDDDRVREIAAALATDEGEAHRRLEENAERMLEAGRVLARAKQVPCTTRVETGDPPRVIDQLACKLGADLILVGKVGQRGVRSWFVGSTTRRLIESTRIPVLVIPGTFVATDPPMAREGA